MEYLIDSNSLIDAHKKWYRPQVFKSVWAFLAADDDVKMTSFVFNEILYPENLVDWAKRTFQQELILPDPQIIVAYGHVMDWISNANRWNAAGIAEWQQPDKADPWLIATAMVNHQMIVTLDGNGRAFMPDVGTLSKQEPKIDAVARQFDVQTITVYELLSRLKLSL